MADTRHDALALVRQQRGAARWPYVLTGLVAFMFVGHAVEDAGWAGAWPYIAILGLSAAGLAWPTILGWALLLFPFLAYGVLVALAPNSGPLEERLIFMWLGFFPALLLWLGRPWARKPSGQPHDQA